MQSLDTATLILLCCIYCTTGLNTKRRVNGHTLALFKDVGLRMCQNRCSKYADCDGVNFKRDELYCELVKDVTPAKFIDDEDYVFSDAKTFELDDSACWPNPCSSGQKCHVAQSGKPVCTKQPYHLHNVALGKSATQYPNDVTHPYYGPPNNATDGNLDTRSHTSPYYVGQHTGDIYWMVDLGENYLIHSIAVISLNAFRFRDINITIGRTPETNMLCAHFVGPAMEDIYHIITCQEPVVGRFVKVSKHMPSNPEYAFIHLLDVKINAHV